MLNAGARDYPSAAGVSSSWMAADQLIFKFSLLDWSGCLPVEEFSFDEASGKTRSADLAELTLTYYLELAATLQHEVRDFRK